MARIDPLRGGCVGFAHASNGPFLIIALAAAFGGNWPYAPRHYYILWFIHAHLHLVVFFILRYLHSCLSIARLPRMLACVDRHWSVWCRSGMKNLSCCFFVGYRIIVARYVAKWGVQGGYRTKKGSANLLRRYRTTWGTAAVVSKYLAIWGH